MSSKEQELDLMNTNQELEIPDRQEELFLSLPVKTQRFIHLYLTGKYTLAKLAELLDVHPNTISKWLRRKDVKEVIVHMQSETHDLVAHQMKNLSLKAIDRLNNLIDSPMDAVALQAVKDVLDRTGHKPKNEIKIDKTVTTVEQRMKELIDQTIDVEILEVINND